MSRLFAAIDAGDKDAVTELVEARPELAAEPNEDGLSPVLHALYKGRGELVEPILDANPPLDAFAAAAVGRTRGLGELLDAEPGLARAWSPDGFTALHLAAYFGQEDAARLLLERGADVHVVSRHETIKVPPLQSAAAGGHREIVELLLEHGADPSRADLGDFR